jgi:hypothetical protein
MNSANNVEIRKKRTQMRKTPNYFSFHLPHGGDTGDGMKGFYDPRLKKSRKLLYAFRLTSLKISARGAAWNIT